MNQNNYAETVETLENLFKFALKLSKDTHGRNVETRREEVASFIFAKIGLHTHSILRLTPRSSYNTPDKELEVWDNTSIAVIARALIEAYYTFYYMAVDEIDQDEIDFRFVLWDYHSENRRLGKLQAIGSKHPDLKQLEKDVEELKKAVERHFHLNKIDKSRHKKILKGDVPTLLTNKKIAEKAGIDPNYHEATYNYLSSYIHTFPFSVSQISSIENTDQILELINVILDECTGYLCFAIRDFVKLFPDQKVYMVESIQETIGIWEYVFRNMSNRN